MLGHTCGIIVCTGCTHSNHSLFIEMFHYQHISVSLDDVFCTIPTQNNANFQYEITYMRGSENYNNRSTITTMFSHEDERDEFGRVLTCELKKRQDRKRLLGDLLSFINAVDDIEHKLDGKWVSTSDNLPGDARIYNSYEEAKAKESTYPGWVCKQYSEREAPVIMNNERSAVQFTELSTEH